MVRAVVKADAMLTLSSAERSIISEAIYHLPFRHIRRSINTCKYNGNTVEVFHAVTLHGIGADSTGATGAFAPVLIKEPGQRSPFAPVTFKESTMVLLHRL